MKRYVMPVRILLEHEAETWFAHCLEFNLLGDGASREAALRALLEAVELQVETTIELGNPMTLFAPADPELLEMFAAGKETPLAWNGLETGPIKVGRGEIRELVDVPAECPTAR